MKRLLFWIGILLCTINAQAQLQSGLVAWYPFNGNTNDSSGNNNNGTIVGNVTLTTDRFGSPGGAYHFDGSSGYVTCPNDSQLLKSKTWSYSVWFRVLNRPGGWQQNVILANIGTYQQSGGFEAGTGNPPQTTCSSMFRNATHLDQALGGNTSIDSGMWYNLIVVSAYDSVANTTTVSNYIDSVLDSRNTFSGSVNYDAITNFWIGANIDISCCQRYFLGDIDDVRLYNIALPLGSPIITDTTINLACGDSVQINNYYYKYTTTVADTFTSIHGTDSIIVYNLYVTDSIFVADTICNGDSVWFNGAWLGAAGTYQNRVAGSGSCDSLTILNLAVSPVPQVTFSWDSLIVSHDISQGSVSDTGYWCQLYPPVFLMSGGSPAGGVYTGNYISNDSIYAGQLMPFGMDTITYTYTNGSNCSASVSVILIADICESVANISNTAILQVYPVPASDRINVIIHSPDAYGQLTITDLLGRTLITQSAIPGVNSNDIDISSLANGVYIVQVLQGNVIKAGSKIVISR